MIEAEDMPLYAGLTVVAVVVAALCYWAHWDSEKWERFSAAHECQQTEQTRMFPIMSCISTGKTVMCYPIFVTERLWTCNDESEHWR